MRSNGERLLVFLVSLAVAPSVLGQAQKGSRPTAPTAGATASPGVAKQAAPPRASTAPGTQPPAVAVDPRKIDQILLAWEQASKGIKLMYAEFDKIDEFKVVGETKKYRGTASFQRPNLARLDFDRDKGNDQFEFEKRLLCTGREVLDIDGTVRQVIIYPLPKDDQEKAIEEGPLRFLFGMTVSDFKRRYVAKLIAETEKTYRIRLDPLLDEDKNAFAAAVLDLNKTTLMPDAIHLMLPNQKDRESYYLKKLVTNQPWEGGDRFAWSPAHEKAWTQKGWNVIHQLPPGEGPAAATVGGPVGLAPRPKAASPGTPR